MKKYLFGILLSFLFLGLPANILAQDITAHPFIAANYNFLGEGLYQSNDAGWGLELGLRYGQVYIDGEYSVYGSAVTTHPYSDYVDGDDLAIEHLDDIPFYESDPHWPKSREHSYGLTVGIVTKDILWVGVSFLLSDQATIHPVRQFNDSTIRFRITDSRLVWFEAGPDVRVQLFDHLLINIAYSHRRGLKSGLGYIF